MGDRNKAAGRLLANYLGIPIVECPGMLPGSWFACDNEGRILISGVWDAAIKTPGLDPGKVEKINASSTVYAAIKAAQP